MNEFIELSSYDWLMSEPQGTSSSWLMDLVKTPIVTVWLQRGPHSTVDNILTSRPAAQVRFSEFPNFFKDKLDVADIYWHRTA